MKPETYSKYHNESLPSTSVVDVDFSKCYENAETDYDVVCNFESLESAEQNPSIAKVVELFRGVASVNIAYRNSQYILTPHIVWGGKRSFMPCDLDADDITFLGKVLPDVRPMLLKAKTAECLWEATKNNQYAGIAEEAYIHLIQEDAPWHKQDDLWGRLLYIEKNLKHQNDSKIKEIASQKIKDGKADAIAVLWFCSRLFKSKDLLDELFSNVVKILRSYFSFINVNDHDDIKPTLNRIRGKDPKTADELTGVLVNSFAKYAEVLASSNALHAAHQYDLALDYVQLISKNSEFDVESSKELYSRRRCELRKQSIKDMKYVYEDIDISESVENAMKYFDSIDDKWKALMDVTRLTVFSKDKLLQLNETVKELIQKSAFFTVGTNGTTIDNFGKVIASNQGWDSSKPLELQDVFKQWRARYFCQTHVEFIAKANILPALRSIVNRFDYSEDELLVLLRDNTNLPATHVYPFAHGLNFVLQGDIFTAIHILSPAFEAFIRDVFVRNGWKTTHINGKIDDFTALGSLVENSESFVNRFGENVQFQMHTIFSDKSGANLRNDIAHGLFIPSERTTMQALYAIAFMMNFMFYEKSLEIKQN